MMIWSVQPTSVSAIPLMKFGTSWWMQMRSFTRQGIEMPFWVYRDCVLCFLGLCCNLVTGGASDMGFAIDIYWNQTIPDKKSYKQGLCDGSSTCELKANGVAPVGPWNYWVVPLLKERFDDCDGKTWIESRRWTDESFHDSKVSLICQEFDVLHSCNLYKLPCLQKQC